MIDVSGNLWDYPAEVTAITTNGVVKANGACVMGRGCAREARDRYPGLDITLGTFIRAFGNRCFRIVSPIVRPNCPLDRTLLTFPVKHRWDEPADLRLIATSCEQAMAMADKFGWKSIVLPRPGCGNGRLNYYDVEPLISDLLDDRFHVITFGADRA